MPFIKAPFVYFLLTYLAGFALGTVRELFVMPRVGLTSALLIEVPIMTVVSFFTARYVVERTPQAKTLGDRLIIGCIALVLLLIVEDAMSHFLRGMSIFAVWAEYPLLAVVANIVGLALFLLMPLMVSAKRVPEKFV
jgi:hypothetical protein